MNCLHFGVLRCFYCVRYYFRALALFGSSENLICIVMVRVLFVFPYTGVQHDFCIRLCSCHFTVTRRMPLAEQELISTCVRPISSGVCVAYCLVVYVVFCFVCHFLSFFFVIVMSLLRIVAWVCPFSFIYFFKYIQ